MDDSIKVGGGGGEVEKEFPINISQSQSDLDVSRFVLVCLPDCDRDHFWAEMENICVLSQLLLCEYEVMMTSK